MRYIAHHLDMYISNSKIAFSNAIISAAEEKGLQEKGDMELFCNDKTSRATCFS
jgi:hypothetical protein